MIIGAIIGAVVAGTIALVSQLIRNGGDWGSLDWGDIGLAVVRGAVIGGIIGAFKPFALAAKKMGAAFTVKTKIGVKAKGVVTKGLAKTKKAAGAAKKGTGKFVNKIATTKMKNFAKAVKAKLSKSKFGKGAKKFGKGGLRGMGKQGMSDIFEAIISGGFSYNSFGDFLQSYSLAFVGGGFGEFGPRWAVGASIVTPIAGEFISLARGQGFGFEKAGVGIATGIATLDAHPVAGSLLKGVTYGIRNRIRRG